MNTAIEGVLAIIDAHIRTAPTAAVLDAWRDLRSYIQVLDDQRWIYFAIGMASGIALIALCLVIGNTHP